MLDFLGFLWILSSESRLFNGLHRSFREKFFLALCVPGVSDSGRRDLLLACGRAGLLIGPSLTLFLISCNELSPTQPSSQSPTTRRLFRLRRGRCRPKSLAEARRSDRARWAPPSRSRGPPLSDGSRHSTGSAFCSGPRLAQSGWRLASSHVEPSPGRRWFWRLGQRRAADKDRAGDRQAKSCSDDPHAS